MTPTITHILDDSTPGGVTRVIDTLMQSEALADQADHRLEMVPSPGRWPRFEGDIIVSHLAINWRTLPALMALRAKHPNAHLIHVEHSYTQRFTALNVSNRDRFFTLLRTAYALFDRVACVSRAQGSWMATRTLVDQSKLRIIRSAVDLAPFAKLAPITDAPKTFGLLGRLHNQKGFDLAIAAFRDLESPEARLKIFGTGEEHEALHALVENGPRISFEGFRADPTEAMAEIDILVVPSRWEAYGLVAQEALAAGRRVLVAPVDGLLDQVEDGAVAMSGLGVASLTSDLQRMMALESNQRVTDQSAFAAESKARFERDWLRLFDEAMNTAKLAA